VVSLLLHVVSFVQVVVVVGVGVVIDEASMMTGGAGLDLGPRRDDLPPVLMYIS
jgi:hypothetical protein